MDTIKTLLDPFFAWKRQSGRRRFDQSSKTKYEQYLLPFAAWASDRAVSEVTTALIEFDFIPGWVSLFENRNGRPPAQNTVRLLHNALASFFDYCWRRGLVPLNPMAAIVRPSYEAPDLDPIAVDSSGRCF